MNDPEKVDDAVSILNNIVQFAVPHPVLGQSVAQLDRTDVAAIRTVLKDRHALYREVDELRKQVDNLITELDWYQR